MPRPIYLQSPLSSPPWDSSIELSVSDSFTSVILSSSKASWNLSGLVLLLAYIVIAGSVLCAIAPTSGVFIAGRAIAELGAAGLLQGALAIITHIVKLERRPTFMGIVISVFGLSVCEGPVLGGAFIDNTSWRWCFWMCVTCQLQTL